MAYFVTKNKKDSLKQLCELVEAFTKNRKAFLSSSYSEAQLRIDFLNPLLKSLGWDVDNESGKAQYLRDVIQEEPINVEVDGVSTKKNPDYTLRIQGTRKLFWEAKKTSINIESSAEAAFQIRRYGWNANLGVSVLVNFNKIIIYDCRYLPGKDDEACVARVKIFNYSEFLDFFDDLYELLSFESVSDGKLDDLFSVLEKVGQTFDHYFLLQIEDWRKKLASSAIQLNKELDSENINFFIQRLLNRIVFLRICEDRALEKFETLKNVSDYGQLKDLFSKSDKKYNSGLFDFIEDTLSLVVKLDADILINIFNELYYPLSPYDFSVVDPKILSQIYEKFLGSKIEIGGDRQVIITEEPEVVASNGVVPTPTLIVEQIVKNTLDPLCENKSLQELSELKVADICCGSGTFLIGIYDYLMEKKIEQLLNEKIADPEIINKLDDGTWLLTLKAKREILTKNIFGVDINPYAVEVSKFSLLLKLLESESADSVVSFLDNTTNKVLPNLEKNIKCGNSLVDNRFYEFRPSALEDNDLEFKINPFQWDNEFPFLKQTDGFDAILGNPPYVRIQNLVKYSPEEIKYYQSEVSGYSVANKETIDKYYIFIQRAISLLNPTGLLGYIVPHKFFLIKGGKTLRKYIIENSYLSKIIHFGVTQIFPDHSTYTAIIIIQKNKREQFLFKKLNRVFPDLLSDDIEYTEHNRSQFSSNPWVFVSPKTKAVFEKLCSSKTNKLNEFAEISVGLQTSCDKVYIFNPESETRDTFIFTKNEIVYEVEKDICCPCLLDLSFRLCDTVEANAQMIFPYNVIGDKAEVIEEGLFATKYPLCWQYLNKHKEILQKRSINGSKNPKWYQFGRSQSLTKFHSNKKLIWHVLSTEPTYILDNKNLQFTGGGNGPYYGLTQKSDHSILYLLGILSHPVFENMVKAGASEFQGSYYSHGKQFLQNLPIRKIDLNNSTDSKTYNEIIGFVERLIAIKDQKRNSSETQKVKLDRKVVYMKSCLDELVRNLYSLTKEEINNVINDELLASPLSEDV